MKTIHVSLLDEAHTKLLQIRDLLGLDNLDEAVAAAIEKAYVVVQKETEK